MRSMLFWGSWRLAFSTPKWSLWWNAPFPIGPPGTISSRTWWRSGASWHPPSPISSDFSTRNDSWWPDDHRRMMLYDVVTECHSSKCETLQWKSKPLCPKERRTSHGGNQMSFPHCRPLAFVSLATFVIWDSATSVTCQNHRDLTPCCRVLALELQRVTEECDARGKRIGGSQRPSNWENQL